MKTRLSLALAIAAIVAVCGLTVVCFAQTTTLDTSGSKVQLVTVYEKTFPDSIVDVVLDEAWVTPQKATVLGWKETKSLEIKNGLVNIAYPKVVITRKALQFYTGDAKGKRTISLKTNEGVIKSSNGQYLVNKLQGTLTEGGATLLDWNGNLLGKIIKGQAKEVSDSGTILVAENIDSETGWPASFVMYDKACKETGRFIIPQRFADIRVEGGGAKLSEDGNYFVVGFGMFSKPDSAVYYLVDAKGKVLWKKEIQYGLTGSMPDNHIICKNIAVIGKVEKNDNSTFVVKGYIVLINWEGIVKTIIPIEIANVVNIGISNEFNKIYAISTEGYLWCVNIKTNSISWTYKESWSPDWKSKSWPKNVPEYSQMIVLNDYKEKIIINGIRSKSFTPYASTIFIFDGNDGKLLSKSEYDKPVNIVGKSYISKIFIFWSNKLQALNPQ